MVKFDEVIPRIISRGKSKERRIVITISSILSLIMVGIYIFRAIYVLQVMPVSRIVLRSIGVLISAWYVTAVITVLLMIEVAAFCELIEMIKGKRKVNH
ncbi:MAG: hypothetical protein IJ215_04535 [Clostridia bacterium]|nr:hypothetical protein [Clostridia bacterium]